MEHPEAPETTSERICRIPPSRSCKGNENSRICCRTAGALDAAFGSLLAIHVVTPHGVRPPALAGARSVVLDPDGAAHNRYGARGQCAYLLRPDGYILSRCQPIEAGERAR